MKKTSPGNRRTYNQAAEIITTHYNDQTLIARYVMLTTGVISISPVSLDSFFFLLYIGIRSYKLVFLISVLF